MVRWSTVGNRHGVRPCRGRISARCHAASGPLCFILQCDVNGLICRCAVFRAAGNQSGDQDGWIELADQRFEHDEGADKGWTAVMSPKPTVVSVTMLK